MVDLDFTALKERIELDRRAVELFFEKNIISTVNGTETLYSSMNYSLLAGGKRVRPFLCIEVCRAFGGDADKAIPLAAAVELIHTYSLIHDDLPCMDDDDLRRGKPTNHKVYGEACAVLAGDALLTKAFELASNANISPDKIIRCIRLMSECAGAEGMIGGQIIDLENENKKISYDTLSLMHSLKTGALIRLSALLGCICAGETEDGYSAVEAYANKIGFVFQIVDDILDVVSDDVTLGKKVGVDLENGKNTFMSFYSVEEAVEIAKKLTGEAVSVISPYDGATDGILTAFAIYLCNREK